MKFLLSRKYLLIITFIFVVGAVLRLYRLDSVPTGPISAELDVYNAVHSIATTGKDVDGQLWPYLYQPANRRNAPIYGITEYYSTLFFGNNVYGLRLPAVFFGLLSIAGIGLLTFELTQNKNAAAFAMFSQAISPIFIHFSRIAWAPASIGAFLLFGLYLLASAFKEKTSYIKLFSGIVVLALTAYTYPAGLLYAPLLGSFILILNYQKFNLKIVPIIIALYFIIVFPVINLFHQDWLTRINTENIETFHNGINLDSLRIFWGNYFSHFGWDYLVTTGKPIPALTWLYLNGFGAFYWWIIALAVIGVGCALYYRTWQHIFLLAWLLIYPLGGALTNEGGFTNAPRTLAAASVFCILAAIGCVALLKDKSLILKIALYCNSIMSPIRFSDYYFNKSIHVNSNAWESGANPTFSLVKTLSPNADRVCSSTYWISQISYLRYYLSDTSVQVLETIDDPSCLLPRTIMITNPKIIAPTGFTKLVDILDVDGNVESTVQVKF